MQLLVSDKVGLAVKCLSTLWALWAKPLPTFGFNRRSASRATGSRLGLRNVQLNVIFNFYSSKLKGLGSFGLDLVENNRSVNNWHERRSMLLTTRGILMLENEFKWKFGGWKFGR
jgi:hypothetical protein